MSQPSLRRRDRRPRLDDEYYGFPDPHAPPPDISPRRAHIIQDNPPSTRSSKHDRPRRYPSPDFARNDPLAAHGSHSGRGSHHSRSVDPAMSSRRRGRSPGYDPEPFRHEKPSSRHSKDLPIRESHRSDRPPRDYQPRHRATSRDGDPYLPRAATLPTGYDSRPPRSRRPVSPEPRSRTRGGPNRDYDYDDYYDRPRRHRSQNPSSRGYNRSPSPPPRSRTHHGGMAAAAGAGAGAAAAGGRRGSRGSGARGARRNSMPATTARVPWWQNPLIQAGGKAAVTAGAQAAMKSRNDQGAWLGAKGAKVATAALGAALVDSFIGQKHPGKHDMARQGLDFATNAVGDYGPRAEQRFRKKR